MAVEITRAKRVYYPKSSQFLDLSVGDVVSGDFAEYIKANEPGIFTELEDPAPVVAPPAEPDEPAVVDPPAPAIAPAAPEQGVDLPAGDSADDPAAPYDPGVHTVAQVLAYAKDHPAEAAAVREAERAGKGRTTILNELA